MSEFEINPARAEKDKDAPTDLSTKFWAAAHTAGQTEDLDPIDKRLIACQQENTDNRGLISCLKQASNSWDEELNKTYKEIMTGLKLDGTPEAQKVMRDSERAWLNYRDKEFALIDKFRLNEPSEQNGNEAPVQGLEKKVDIVKQRVLELRDLQEQLAGD